MTEPPFGLVQNDRTGHTYYGSLLYNIKKLEDGFDVHDWLSPSQIEVIQ